MLGEPIFVGVFMSEALEGWLTRRRNGGALLQWFGKAAQAMGLEGEAELEEVLSVLCDGYGPHGERVRNFTAATYELVDGMTFNTYSHVSYLVRFLPHWTAGGLMEGPQASEAHRVAVADALEFIEDVMPLELVGVDVTIYDDTGSALTNEVVVAASGYDGVEWRSLGTERILRDEVAPALWSGVAFYQRRLGEELKDRLGVEIEYEPSRPTQRLIAVMSS